MPNKIKSLPALKCQPKRRAKVSYPELYGQRAWRESSKAFLASNPFCTECDCPAQVVDHIKQHNGDLDLFWDVDNWQPLCRRCHGKKSRHEQLEMEKKRIPRRFRDRSLGMWPRD